MQREKAVGAARTYVVGLLEEEDGPDDATDDKESDDGAAIPGVAVGYFCVSTWVISR